MRDIVAARAGVRINRVNSVGGDAFPQHNIGGAECKEILVIVYKYKYAFGLAVVGCVLGGPLVGGMLEEGGSRVAVRRPCHCCQSCLCL